MFRYLAFLWNPLDPKQVDVAGRLCSQLEGAPQVWSNAMMRHGAAVFCAGAASTATEVCVLPRASGVVVGCLFTGSNASDEECHPAVLDESASAAILATRGRRLIDSYWGSYVAFLVQDGTKWVLRGPMSTLHCFWTRVGGVQIVFSAIQDCISLGALRYSVNWDLLAAHIMFAPPQVAETGVNEISRIEGGECVEIRCDDSSTRHVYWHPCSVARLPAVEDAQAAASLLRRVARKCIHAWASRHSSIVHRLSGGFDSSLVLSFLSSASSKPRVTCLHQFTLGPYGDERAFARAAVARCGAKLIERERDSLFPLASMQELSPTVAPLWDFEFESDRAVVRLAHEHHATAISNGYLGDVLFVCDPWLAGAAEYVQRHGLGPGLLQVALDVAQRRQISLWKVLRRAMVDRRFVRNRGYWSQYELAKRDGRATRDERLASAETAARFECNIARFTHPWLHATQDVPMGALWMTAAMTVEAAQTLPFAQLDDPAVTIPLSSQPLVELCLRIPCYLAGRDAWDRAVARQAFSGDLPTEILSRTTKGSSHSWGRRVVAESAEFVREYLLDGLLVKEHVLDRAKVEAAMPGMLNKSAGTPHRLVEHLYSESWLRCWSALSRYSSSHNPRP